ncbi:MAG TPA: Gfo/Idh/MocA family oxidoreductase [Opitutaceae bacterium]|nr:Gfo/Idh/MocA family oxidoreductase [Opitutaceae bacterium]
MTPLKIGFIGAGKQAQSVHLPSYASIENCQIAGIADLDADLAARVAARYGVPHYGTHQELLTKEKPDAVVVTLPPLRATESLIFDVLDARVPLIVEKPLAWTIPAAERICARQRRTGTPLLVGYHKRSDPATMYAKTEIEKYRASGELGALRYARVHVALGGDWTANAYRGTLTGKRVMQREALPADEFRGMSEAARLKFEMFTGTHSHQLDLMHHLIGPYRIAHVDPSGVLLVVTGENGLPGVFEFKPYTSTKDWRENAFVAFERGYVQIDLPAPLAINRAGTVEVFRDLGGESTPITIRPVLPAVSAMTSQARNFIRFLSGESTPLCSASEALAALVTAREWAMAPAFS